MTRRTNLIDNPTETEDSVSLDQLGQDISGVVSSLQSGLDRIRQSAEQEVARVRAEHEAEREQWQRQINELRDRRTADAERFRALKQEASTVLSDYRAELETQVQRAYAARRQIERLQQLLSSMSELTPDDSQPIPTLKLEGAKPAQPQDAASSDAAPSGDSPDQITGPIAVIHPAGNEIPVSIAGVSSVSRMMKARKLLEGLQDVQHVENRYVADSTLHFTVRTEDTPESLVTKLTSLPESTLKVLEVSGGGVKMEI